MSFITAPTAAQEVFIPIVVVSAPLSPPLLNQTQFSLGHGGAQQQSSKSLLGSIHGMMELERAQEASLARLQMEQRLKDLDAKAQASKPTNGAANFKRGHRRNKTTIALPISARQDDITPSQFLGPHRASSLPLENAVELPRVISLMV